MKLTETKIKGVYIVEPKFLMMKEDGLWKPTLLERLQK